MLTLALSAGLCHDPVFLPATPDTRGTGVDLRHPPRGLGRDLWTGGLAFLVFGLLIAETDCWPLATGRRLNMAVGSVVALLAAGIVSTPTSTPNLERALGQPVRPARTGEDRAGDPAPLALGAYNNRYAVPRLKAGMASVLERRRFLRVAGVELGIMVVIVGITAVLVNSEPARTMAMEMEAGEHTAMADSETTPSRRAVRGSVILGEMEAMVTVDPAGASENAPSQSCSRTPPSRRRKSASRRRSQVRKSDRSTSPQSPTRRSRGPS